MMKERFNEEERATFLIFVWGRSRLPTRVQDFDQKFSITGHSRSSSNPDGWFPIAHTCGFSVELPKYTNIDIMTKRIKWAMNNCQSTDADGSVSRGGNVIGMEDEDEQLESLWS
eukprot:CAMPEP_0167765182 /NCGR_PEP_ID=MMETSP0110_2-20121227/14520_1 /TAXON_ID=629695 /ORGANISM="Gymnochlora sp., Strain CCMP2014" /LENGTH=113 /DNA_ID=CAMNT_0007652817 /DNA_START=123 /DNA_END=464 /DNA_ORIENTATION=-